MKKFLRNHGALPTVLVRRGLEVLETGKGAPPARSVPLVRPRCTCFLVEQNLWWRGGATDDVAECRRRRREAGDVTFHAERQDTNSDAWKRLLELVDGAAAKGATRFAAADLGTWGRNADRDASLDDRKTQGGQASRALWQSPRPHSAGNRRCRA